MSAERARGEIFFFPSPIVFLTLDRSDDAELIAFFYIMIGTDSSPIILLQTTSSDVCPLAVDVISKYLSITTVPKSYPSRG